MLEASPKVLPEMCADTFWEDRAGYLLSVTYSPPWSSLLGLLTNAHVRAPDLLYGRARAIIHSREITSQRTVCAVLKLAPPGGPSFHTTLPMRDCSCWLIQLVTIAYP